MVRWGHFMEREIMRILERPEVTLEWATPEPDFCIERAGRTCYKSKMESLFTDRDEATGKVDMVSDGCLVVRKDGKRECYTPDFIRRIIKRGHESVLEHASASFRIVTDRGVTHELVRHRLASYSQESTRYCNYADGKFDGEITVVKPSTISDKARPTWELAVKEAERSYLEMIRVGEPAQVARSVLPTCLKAEIVMTANFREWRHFLKLRLEPAAHPDMRVVARMIHGELKKLSLVVFGDIK